MIARRRTRTRAVALLETCIVLPFVIAMALLALDFGSLTVAKQRASAGAHFAAASAAAVGGTAVRCGDEPCAQTAFNSWTANTKIADPALTLSGAELCSGSDRYVAANVSYSYHSWTLSFVNTISSIVVSIDPYIEANTSATAYCEVRG